MKKIYIAGCGGMLGEAFYKQFGNDYLLKCTDKDVNDTWSAIIAVWKKSEPVRGKLIKDLREQGKAAKETADSATSSPTCGTPSPTW